MVYGDFIVMLKEQEACAKTADVCCKCLNDVLLSALPEVSVDRAELVGVAKPWRARLSCHRE